MEDTEINHRPSICFVSLDNYATLVDDPEYGNMGGAERQQAIIGRALAERGYKVSFITLDHGQDDEMEIDGMRIIKAYHQNEGLRILRFVHPRLTSLWRAMRRANADIYYQRTRDSDTGIVAAFCRYHRRNFIFASAGDYDCITELPGLPTRHSHFYRYGLRHANLVIAQTVTQQKLLRENFGVSSTIIPNCAPDYGNDYTSYGKSALSNNKRLLWIGRFTPVKRLELLLDVAEQLEDFRFDILGDGNTETKYVRMLLLRAKSMKNVYLHGVVSHASIHKFYRKSSILVCTSRVEGFPNTFLEAWSFGLPVVSTYDPDDVIASNGLGIVAEDVSELMKGIRELMDSPGRWNTASQCARGHYLNNHSKEVTIGRFAQILNDIPPNN